MLRWFRYDWEDNFQALERLGYNTAAILSTDGSRGDAPEVDRPGNLRTDSQESRHPTSRREQGRENVSCTLGGGCHKCGDNPCLQKSLACNC